MEIPSRRENLEALFQTIRDLVPERDLEKLLQRVIDKSTEILGAERALLFLLDRKSGALVYNYGVNVEEGFIEIAHQFSSGVLERAMKGEVIMTTDAQADDDFFITDSVLEYDIKTILCAPVMSKGNLIGVIYADTHGEPILLDDERKNYFMSFVDLIANVIVRDLDLNDKDDELSYLKKRLATETILPEIVGRSATIKNLKDQILKISSVNYPVSVLILGESGSGKELIAQALHKTGMRSAKPLVVVNCAAIPASLMESELFGHEKGAFTGAHSRKQGFFEISDGGVIFLDEIGDLPVELQPKLLRVLQFGTFTRIGSRTERSANVQVFCATSKDLYQEMEEGRFRKALFHRLAVEVVHIPPLRERKEDILFLANHFLQEFSEKMGRAITGIDSDAQNLLKMHDYRGNNVRELKNVIERAILEAEGKKITAKDIVFSDELLMRSRPQFKSGISADPGETSLLQVNEELVVSLFEGSRDTEKQPKREKPYYRVYALMEQKLILLALRRSGWKIKPAALLLGIDHNSFRNKLTSIIKELLEKHNGDREKVSSQYRIPLSFLTSGRSWHDPEKTP